jgi:hypothetical protein
MPEDFKSNYLTAAQNLFGPLPANSGIEEKDLLDAAENLGVRIPKDLHDYYVALGNFDRLNKVHNKLLSPSEWFIDTDYFVFMEENQCVVFWSVPIKSDEGFDTVVYQGVNAEEGPIEWRLEHKSCSEFLLVMMHWQAVCGGFDWIGSAELEKTDIKHFQNQWQRVGQINELQAFCRAGRTACLIEEGEKLRAYVGANTEAMFDEMIDESRSAGIEIEGL